MMLAVCCGYYVVSTSDTVGNAIIDIHKSTAVLPPGFSVGETSSDSVSLYEKEGVAKIFIKDLGKGDIASDEIEKKNKSLSSSADIKIIDNNHTTLGDAKIYTIYYQNTSDTESFYYSVSYLNTYNRTFLLKCEKFDNTAEIDKNLNLLTETIKPDYKKSQE